MVVIQLLEVIKNPTKQTAIYRAKPHLLKPEGSLCPLTCHCYSDGHTLVITGYFIGIVHCINGVTSFKGQNCMEAN